MKQLFKSIPTFAILLCLSITAFGQVKEIRDIPPGFILSINKPHAKPKEFLTNYPLALGTWNETPIPISEYTDEELKLQEEIHSTLLDKGLVLTYSPLPDKYLYDDRNDLIPVEQRDIDNEPITPQTWKNITFELTEIDGSKLTAQLSRPNWWIKHHKATEIGNKVFLSIEEMGIYGDATVTKIAPISHDTRLIPMQDSGSVYGRRPITGRFVRTVEETWNFVFSNGDTIGSTPNHPFYSEDRQVYIPIGDIKIGENIKVYGEKTAKLVSKARREILGNKETVYNLEVYRDHNFHVGHEGLLVHNSCVEIVKRIRKMTPDQIKQHISDGWDVVIKSSDDIPAFFGVRRYFQDLMSEFRYLKEGFKSTADIADNFKALDFYKQVGGSGNNIVASKVISMKTTKVADVNTWKNYQSVKDNIANIKQGLQNGIEWNNKTINFTSPEIHIYMPKNVYSQSLASSWKSTLEGLHPEIKFEINILENYIK
ncbi:MAG TPA: polymorphic toxin-type HINT domain-containing protein [Flavilitoribacter sp.]|nr:polymorphic toxin-type HINT domain-containing protein [Flavilitoribacter sp.]